MTFLLNFFTSFLLSIFFTYAIIYYNKKYSFFEKIRDDRWHKSQVGKYGGVGIWLSFLITCFIFSDYSHFKIILFFGSASFCLGLLDDIFDIKPQIKMLFVIIMALVSFYLGFRFMPSMPVYITLPLTILWFSGIINAVNLIDNLDGLSSGISIISLLVISLFLFTIKDFETMSVSITLIGACLGFIIFNFPPAKIFMGDSGSFFLGTCLSFLCLKLTSEPANSVFATFLIPVLIMIIPIFDTTFVSINRYLKNIPISTGGLDHPSHTLVKLGFSNRQTILILFCISLSFGAIVFFSDLNNYRWWVPILVIALIILFLIGLFLSYHKQDMFLVNEKINEKNNYLLKRAYKYKKQIVEMVIDSLLIGGAFTISHLLRFEYNINEQIWKNHDKVILLFVLIKISIFYIFDLYRGLWKYASIPDLVRVLKSNFFGSSIVILVMVLIDTQLIYSRSVLVIDFILTFFFISGFRLFYRIFLQFIQVNDNKNPNGKRVLFIGISEKSINLLRLLNEDDNDDKLNIVGILGSSSNYFGRLILNIPVLGEVKNFENLIIDNDIELVIDAEENSFSKPIKTFCEHKKIIYNVPTLKLA